MQKKKSKIQIFCVSNHYHTQLSVWSLILWKTALIPIPSPWSLIPSSCRPLIPPPIYLRYYPAIYRHNFPLKGVMHYWIPYVTNLQSVWHSSSRITCGYKCLWCPFACFAWTDIVIIRRTAWIGDASACSWLNLLTSRWRSCWYSTTSAVRT